MTPDPLAANEWVCVAREEDVRSGARPVTVLLGRPLRLGLDEHRRISARVAGAGVPLPTQCRYGHVFVALGDAPRPLLEMPEFAEPGRRLIACGAVTVRASPLRIVENFLDMGHFPFVHPNILGAEPDTTVAPYRCEIRADVDEVWATECAFYQQQAAMSATQGITTDYQYRVSSPFITVLYKTCPARADAWDLIGLFVQPRSETRCDVHPVMSLYDDENSDVALNHFQQVIFTQDRSILENQRPALMPLEPGHESPVRADLASVTYRRWLQARGWTYGALKAPGAPKAS